MSFKAGRIIQYNHQTPCFLPRAETSLLNNCTHTRVVTDTTKTMYRYTILLSYSSYYSVLPLPGKNPNGQKSAIG